MPRDSLPMLGFGSAAEWEGWLAACHADSPGVWLKIAKKGSRARSVTYAEALDGALCFGWIDGQKAALDEMCWLQRFTPRKAGSRWSKLNAERAEALIESGRMRPAGLREVERARADGRWEQAYAPQSRAEPPEDFARALAENDEARAFFATLSGANRYAVLYRIGSARRPETRARRIAEFTRMLSEHRTIYP